MDRLMCELSSVFWSLPPKPAMLTTSDEEPLAAADVAAAAVANTMLDVEVDEGDEDDVDDDDGDDEPDADDER